MSIKCLFKASYFGVKVAVALLLCFTGSYASDPVGPPYTTGCVEKTNGEGGCKTSHPAQGENRNCQT